MDAWQFEATAERAPERAAGLFRGEFLEGFAVTGAPAFEDWASAERTRYRSRTAAVLVAQGEGLLDRCRFAEAGDAARRALSIEPYSEPGLRLLMRAGALAGDLASALAAYHEFSSRLADGIKEQPSAALRALAERIRRSTWRPTPAPDADREPPLVGREQLHREAFEVLAAGLATGPRTLMIVGAPGMGCTRLLAECAGRLALEGAVVLRARPLESDHDAPLSTLRLLLGAGLQRAPGLMAAPADALAVLAGLVPDLGDRAPPRAPRDAADLATALAAGLGAVAAEQPLGLALDDAHLADGTTLGALAAALERLGAVPVVCVVTTTDSAEHAPEELRRLRGAIGRGLAGATVRLPPFADVEMGALVSTLAEWCRDGGERDRLTRRLAFDTGGNPLYAVTLLGGLQRMARLRTDFVAWPRPQATLDTPLPFTLPDVLRSSIAARVAELEAETQRVLSAASLCGLALDLDLIAMLTDLPRATIEDRLAAAERRHLVTFDGQRYTFAAPLIADVVRGECLTAGQRRAIRERAIAALAGREGLEARVLRVELLAAATPGREAFEEAVAVARAALDGGSRRTARRALAAAERAAAKEPPAARETIEMLRRQLPE